MSFQTWINLENKEVLFDRALAISRLTRDRILASGRWRPSPTTRAADEDIDLTFQRLVEGQASMEDYREACDRWFRAGFLLGGSGP